MTAIRPTDVVVVRFDDTRVPCELVYEGLVEVDGARTHVWVSVTEVGVTDRVECAVLPPHTTIRFATREEP